MKKKRYDYIDEVEKFNPYHGEHGRFSSENGVTSMTTKEITANDVKNLPLNGKIQARPTNGGTYRTYTRTAWGLSRDPIPGYNPGMAHSMIMDSELEKYEYKNAGD